MSDAGLGGGTGYCYMTAGNALRRFVKMRNVSISLMWEVGGGEWVGQEISNIFRLNTTQYCLNRREGETRET